MTQVDKIRAALAASRIRVPTGSMIEREIDTAARLLSDLESELATLRARLAEYEDARTEHLRALDRIDASEAK